MMLAVTGRRKQTPAEAEPDGLDDLYLGDFEGFVARRDALAKKLRGDGDADAAERVRALKKPARTAWAVNQFSAHGEKLRKELLSAGSALRDAQEQLVAGDAGRDPLKKARDQERSAVSGALEAIQALADKAGAELSPAAADRVRHTLHAVALDDDVRAQFEAQRLTTDHEATGLGSAPAAGGGPARPAAKQRGQKDKKAADQKRRRREELKESEAEAKKLDRELAAADTELEEAQQEATRAQRALKRATKQQEQAAAAAEAAAARLSRLQSEGRG
jgi:chromosome segregation ATPase